MGKLNQRLLANMESGGGNKKAQNKKVNRLVDQKNVKDLRNHLVQEMSNQGRKKEEVVIPSAAGTSNIKKALQKLTKEEDVKLLGPRMRRVNREMQVVDDGVKSLEEIKAQQDNTR